MASYTVDSPEVTEVMAKASEIVGEMGHAKETYEKADGSLCSLGAIRKAIYGYAIGIYEDNRDVLWAMDRDNLYWASQNRLEKIISKEENPTPYPLDIATWNDMKERTGEDVVLALKKAAHLYE